MKRYNAEEEKRRNVIGSRLSQARKQHGLTLSSLSKLLPQYGIPVGRTAINKWEMGERIPNAYQLLAICQALEIDEETFSYLTGCSNREDLNAEGLGKLNAYREDLIATGRYRPEEEPAEVVYLEMPVSALAASAGTGVFLDEGSFEMTRVPASEVPEGAAFGVRVSGNSMEPVYHDGQIVWVKPCDTLRVGEVGIFVYDGEGYIKVYGTQMPADVDREAYTRSDGTVIPQPVLISYNPAYAPRVVSPDMGFRIAGRVL